MTQAPTNLESLISELTLAEKASLCSG